MRRNVNTLQRSVHLLTEDAEGKQRAKWDNRWPGNKRIACVRVVSRRALALAARFPRPGKTTTLLPEYAEASAAKRARRSSAASARIRRGFSRSLLRLRSRLCFPYVIRIFAAKYSNSPWRSLVRARPLTMFFAFACASSYVRGNSSEICVCMVYHIGGTLRIIRIIALTDFCFEIYIYM